MTSYTTLTQKWHWLYAQLRRLSTEKRRQRLMQPMVKWIIWVNAILLCAPTYAVTTLRILSTATNGTIVLPASSWNRISVQYNTTGKYLNAAPNISTAVNSLGYYGIGVRIAPGTPASLIGGGSRVIASCNTDPSGFCQTANPSYGAQGYYGVSPGSVELYVADASRLPGGMVTTGSFTYQLVSKATGNTYTSTTNIGAGGDVGYYYLGDGKFTINPVTPPTCTITTPLAPVNFGNVSITVPVSGQARFLAATKTANTLSVSCNAGDDAQAHNAIITFAGTSSTTGSPNAAGPAMLRTSINNTYIIGDNEANNSFWNSYNDNYCNGWGQSSAVKDAVLWNGTQTGQRYYSTTIPANQGLSFNKVFSFALCSYGVPVAGDGTATATYTVTVQ